MIDETFVSAEFGHKARVARTGSGRVMLSVTRAHDQAGGGHATYVTPAEARQIAGALVAASEEPAFKVGDVVETPAGNVGFVMHVASPDLGANALVRECGRHTEMLLPLDRLTLLERDGKPVQ